VDLAQVIARLQADLPAGTVLSDRDLIAGFEVDVTGRFKGRAAAVARPRQNSEVESIVKACAADGLPVVAQGGNTGLVGGGVPRDGELVISLAGLDWIGEVDLVSGQVEVGAGATLERVQAQAAAAGLEFPLDHPARASATVGGSVATDAGGAFALRHGTMRQRVVGLEVVLPSGETVRRMAGLLKDNAGYDLPALLVGSEGTLGIVTAARLQLVPAQASRIASLFGLGGIEEGLDLLAALRQVPGLEAADFFDSACMSLVSERGVANPLPGDYGFFLVAQHANDVDVTELLAEAVADLAVEPAVAVATDTERRRRLWRSRESINESIQQLGVPHKLDVAVPLAALPRFEHDLRRSVAGQFPGARLFLYGHLGDGNVHVNVVGLAPEDEAIDELVLRCACDLGGTISAEHGVGFAKRRYLSLCRSQADIAAMGAVKRALDPRGIMAPGRVLG
jgi:FAD/FMN-containing dehydrogenase